VLLGRTKASRAVDGSEWKGQHASLIWFASDAYLNQIGITRPLFPDEDTSSGRFVGLARATTPAENLKTMV
jgi:hypothetical protein